MQRNKDKDVDKDVFISHRPGRLELKLLYNFIP